MSAKGFFIGTMVTLAIFAGSISYCLNYLGITSQSSESLPINCSNGSAHSTLVAAHNPSLRKLAEYEVLCGGSAVDSLMTFMPMPTNETEALSYATTTAEVLKEFATYHIAPLVVFEPTSASKTIIADIKNGTHDQAIKAYFAHLKTAGIADEQMGTWVLFPEANTPIWHNTNPEDFAVNVAKVSGYLKSDFPAAKTSILLNSWTYPSDDDAWNKGELKSLRSYVKNLPSDSIDSIGLQGFPYTSPASTPFVSRLEARDFLSANLLKEMAEVTKKRDTWINTGTFRRMHAGDQSTEVRLSAENRAKILTSVLNEAKILLNDDLTVLVNIFAEDKSHTSERVDWSYWSSATPSIGSDAEALKVFLKHLRKDDINFSLYDTVK